LVLLPSRWPVVTMAFIRGGKMERGTTITTMARAMQYMNATPHALYAVVILTSPRALTSKLEAGGIQ